MYFWWGAGHLASLEIRCLEVKQDSTAAECEVLSMGSLITAYFLTVILGKSGAKALWLHTFLLFEIV